MEAIITASFKNSNNEVFSFRDIHMNCQEFTSFGREKSSVQE